MLPTTRLGVCTPPKGLNIMSTSSFLKRLNICVFKRVNYWKTRQLGSALFQNTSELYPRYLKLFLIFFYTSKLCFLKIIPPNTLWNPVCKREKLNRSLVKHSLVRTCSNIYLNEWKYVPPFCMLLCCNWHVNIWSNFEEYRLLIVLPEISAPPQDGAAREMPVSSNSSKSFKFSSM